MNFLMPDKYYEYNEAETVLTPVGSSVQALWSNDGECYSDKVIGYIKLVW